MIYFITQEDRKYVKIGFTSVPISLRLKGLQTGNPHKLSVIDTMDGGVQSERNLHKLFSEDHYSGEWFVYSDSIKEYLQGIRTLWD